MSKGLCPNPVFLGRDSFTRFIRHKARRSVLEQSTDSRNHRLPQLPPKTHLLDEIYQIYRKWMKSYQIFMLRELLSSKPRRKIKIPMNSCFFFVLCMCNGSSIGCQVPSTLRKIIIVNSNWSTRINFTEWTKERYSRDRLPPKITFSFQVDHCHHFDGEVEVEYETLMGAGEWRDIKQRVNSLPD